MFLTNLCIFIVISYLLFFWKLRIFFCTLLINSIVSLIKMYNICLDGSTCFSKDSKSHHRDDTWL